MKAQLIRFADLPLELIEQKEDLELSAVVFLEKNPDLYTVRLSSDNGELLGAGWFIHDRLYNQLLADNIIVDEKHRGVRVMKEAYLLLHDVAMEIARGIGAKRVVGTSEYPRLIRRFYPKAKQVAYVYAEEV
jgi:hypothetical protein